MTTTILALDISSIAFGYCFYDGAVQDHGVILLQHADINHRCRLGRAQIAGLIYLYSSLDAVAIEGPASPHKGALIPQCLVSGAIRSYIAELDIAVCDIPPQRAKQALAGKGNATKEEMLRAAAPHFGYCAETLVYRCRRDAWAAWLDGCAVPEYTEHEADALGVALAATKVVTVERQAA